MRMSILLRIITFTLCIIGLTIIYHIKTDSIQYAIGIVVGILAAYLDAFADEYRDEGD